MESGEIHTPRADGFLDGITRRPVIPHAELSGVKVAERHIKPEELSAFSECFITGSAAEVTPVSEIGAWRFTPGKISETLMNDYMAEVQPQRAAA